MNKKNTLAAIAAVAVLAPAGGAIAAKPSLITGKQIKNGTVRAADLKPGSVSQKRLAPGVVKLLNQKATAGTAGPAGPAGAPGAAGKDGAAGPAGKDGAAGKDGKDGAVALVKNVTTDASTPGFNAGLGLVLPVPVEGSSVFTADKGVALVSTTLPAGRYVIAGTAAFYAVGASSGQYGEARLFAGTTPVGSSIFSGEVAPAALGGVGANAGASVEVNLTAETTVTLRGRIRDTVAGASNVGGGANLLITPSFCRDSA